MAKSPSPRAANKMRKEVTTTTAQPEGLAPVTVIGINSQRYNAGKSTREPYLRRARDAALLTIPFLFREEGDDGSTDPEVPWNSLGAYLVSNVSSKMFLALFPPGRPAFKAKPSKETLADLLSMEPAEQEPTRLNIDTGLSQFEQEVTSAIDEDGDAAKLAMAIVKMVVGGTHALHLYPDGKLRGVPLDRFVCFRDPAGNLLEWVIEDRLDWESLPPGAKVECLKRGFKLEGPASGNDAKRQSIKLYTRGYLSNGRWIINQELYNWEVTGSRQSLNPEMMPYLFLPFTLIEGEDYGRSYCEQYMGDLQTIEGITQTITEAAAAIASFIRFVNPTGLTSKKAVAEARNGDVLSGRADDVSTLQANKVGDLQTADAAVQRAEARLSRAFLLNSAVQRGGERVTAEEIRYVAQELDDILGGTYSQQAVTFQGPYLKLKMRMLQRTARVTPLPPNSVNFVILTGKAALGRNSELAALDSLIGPTMQLFGPEQTLKALGPGFIRDYVQRRATALGVPIKLPSEEEAAQMDQTQMMQDMIAKLGPEGIKQLGGNITANQVADTNAQSRVDAASQKALPAPAQTPTQ